MTTVKNNEPAGFFIRLVANLTDTMIVTLPFVLLAGIFIWFSEEIGNLSMTLILTFSFWLLMQILIWEIYHIFLTTYFGGSLGKKLFGLSVFMANGDKVSLKDSVFRYIVGYNVSNLVLGLGYFWILRNKERRGFHDLLADTKVQITDPNGLFVGLLVFFGLLLIYGVFCGLILFKILSFPI